MNNYRSTVLNGQGNPIVGATVLVVHRETSQVATLYSDEIGTVLANPTTTDSFGEFMFYADDGSYDITISKRGITTRTIEDIELGGVATLPPGTVGNFSSLEASGEVSLGGAPGAAALHVSPKVGQTNFVAVEGALSGSAATLSAQGADASVSLDIQYKNDASIRFRDNATGAEQFRIAHTPQAVNSLQVRGGATRLPPSLTAIGSDDHIGLDFMAKGMGVHSFKSNNGEQLRIGAMIDAINHVQLDGGFKNMAPAVKAGGENTNVGMSYVSQGYNGHRFDTHGGGSTHLLVGNGATNCFNYLNVYGAVFGGTPGFAVRGPDTDIGMELATKGTGSVSVRANFKVAVAGNGLQVKEGTNAKQGVATLVGGTVTVANTSVTTSSRIFLTAQTVGGTPGALYVGARASGTSFTITSTSASDTSVVAYQIFEPA